MIFDYLNGLFINGPLIITANHLVTGWQKQGVIQMGLFFPPQVRCLMCGIEMEVTLRFYLLRLLTSRLSRWSHPLLTPVCVSFPMYLSFPLPLKQDVIFIRKGQPSMYHQRIFMYMPRIRRTWVHHTALCINGFAKGISVFSRHHLRFSCKSLKEKQNVCCSRLFGVTGNCAACSKLIPAFEMVMRAKDNVYHLDCFACQLCNQRYSDFILSPKKW